MRFCRKVCLKEKFSCYKKFENNCAGPKLGELETQEVCVRNLCMRGLDYSLQTLHPVLFLALVFIKGRKEKVAVSWGQLLGVQKPPGDAGRTGFITY